MNIPGYGEEVRQKVTEANKAALYLNLPIWRKKYINRTTKARINITTVGPIMACAAKTRAGTSKTKRLLETTEMEILRRISRM